MLSGEGPPPAIAPPATGPRPAGPRLAAVAIDATEVPDEVLVSQPPSEPDGTIEAAAQRLGLTILERANVALLAVRVIRLRIPDGRPVGEVIQALSAEPGLGPVQSNYIYRRQQGDRPSPAAPQYALQKIAADGEQLKSTGRNVVVAIIDTGVDGTHPDLRRASLASHDVIGESAPEDVAHATAIAGIIAARGLTRGIAPDARLLSVRTFASFGSPGASSRSTTLVVLKALDEAVARKARVLNLSFSGPRDLLIQSAVSKAIERKTVVIAAAGNEGDKAGPAFPGAYPDVVAVTAIDIDDRLYPHANRGAYISVAAPGVDVLAASSDHGHELVSGTSFAAAHVSALAALMLQTQPDLGPREVRRILEETGRDLGEHGHDHAYGAGLVNAEAVLAHKLVRGNAP